MSEAEDLQIQSGDASPVRAVTVSLGDVFVWHDPRTKQIEAAMVIAPLPECAPGMETSDPRQYVVTHEGELVHLVVFTTYGPSHKIAALSFDLKPSGCRPRLW